MIEQQTLDTAQRSAQSLAASLDRLLDALSWQPSEVRWVAVASGPGSFTGLRVGVTTAKVFAYAVQADLIAVDTLAAVAEGVPPATSPLHVVFDAQRGDVYAAAFRRATVEDPLEQVMPTQILPSETWLASLEEGARVAGPMLERLADRLPAGVTAVDKHDWIPTAAGVGRLAWARYERDERDDLWSLVPRYLRRSAAEEKLLARTGQTPPA